MSTVYKNTNNSYTNNSYTNNSYTNKSNLANCETIREKGYEWFVDEWNKCKRRFKLVIVNESPYHNLNNKYPINNKYSIGNLSNNGQNSEGILTWWMDGKCFDAITGLCYWLTGKYYKSLEYQYASSEINLDLGTARRFVEAVDNRENELRRYL